jgi:hypothetical protein
VSQLAVQDWPPGALPGGLLGAVVYFVSSLPQPERSGRERPRVWAPDRATMSLSFRPYGIGECRGFEVACRVGFGEGFGCREWFQGEGG